MIYIPIKIKIEIDLFFPSFSLAFLFYSRDAVAYSGMFFYYWFAFFQLFLMLCSFFMHMLAFKIFVLSC